MDCDKGIRSVNMETLSTGNVCRPLKRPRIENGYIQEAQALKAREMNKLSPTEREAVLDDLHGVSESTSETSLQGKLLELQSLIDTLADEELEASKAYRLARSRNSAYTQDQSRLLAFLRASSFQPRLAAQHFLAFFEEKLELFGPEKLCRSISLSDFTQADMEVLESGQWQLLSKKDQSGRRILCNVQSRTKYQDPLNLLRVVYYLTLEAVQDEESQRKGLVCVLYNIGKDCQGQWSEDVVHRLAKLFRALPARFVGTHHCCNSDVASQRANYEIQAWESSMRMRCQLHNASAMEIQYTLSSFAIPRNTLPVSIFGKLQAEEHKKWLALRQPSTPVVVAEEVQSIPMDVSSASSVDGPASSSSSTTSNSQASPCHVEEQGDVPTCNDVLFGRGRVKEHPGNILLHQLVGERRQRYEMSEKWEKTVIAEEIVAIIRDRSGRFLKPVKSSPTGWVAVDVETAREKVSHTFRSARPKRRKPDLQSIYFSF